MPRRDIGTDDPRVRVRARRHGTPPRTKRRPEHTDAHPALVTTVDRGRYTLLTDDGVELTAMKARELGRGAKNAVVVGDRVGVVGDVSGRSGSLARIVRIEPRRTSLRRSAEDGEAAGVERVIVANADQLIVVTALADPEPRSRMIDRCLVAAYDAGMEPILCLTKADIADPEPWVSQYSPLGLRIVTTERSGSGEDVHGLNELRELLRGQVSVLVGHSGVGKSTLINALIPEAARATSHVNPVTGRGRHTSSSAVALPLAEGGWAIDTPGVRSFGLAHVSTDDLLRGFADLAQAAHQCPRGCTHAADAPDCALDSWVSEHPSPNTAAARLDSFRRLAAARATAESSPDSGSGR